MIKNTTTQKQFSTSQLPKLTAKTQNLKKQIKIHNKITNQERKNKDFYYLIRIKKKDANAEHENTHPMQQKQKRVRFAITL